MKKIEENVSPEGENSFMDLCRGKTWKPQQN